MSNTQTTTQVGAFGKDNPVQLGVPQRVFGELLSLAWPVVKEYRSDLYHDALWLNEHITNGITELDWWFAVRDSGTHLSQEWSWISAVKSNWPAAIVYHCVLRCESKGVWYLTVTTED